MENLFTFNYRPTITLKRKMAAPAFNDRGETVKRSYGGSTGNITFDSNFTANIRSNGFYDMVWKIYRDCETDDNRYVLYPEAVTSDKGLRKFGAKNRHMSLMSIPVSILGRLGMKHLDTYFVDVMTAPVPRIILRDRNKSSVIGEEMMATIYCKAVGEIKDDVIIADSTEFKEYRQAADTVKNRHQKAHDDGKITIPYYQDIIVEQDKRHCDHIFSCKDGFLNNIPPELISHPSNLQFMDGHLNSSKGAESWKTLSKFKNDIVESGDYPMSYIEDSIKYFR